MIQSIERAMKIIYTLASDEKQGAWSITEISECTKLPLSTVYRLLDTLSNFDLVAQEPHTKQFKLGYTWMELGLKLFGNLDFRETARPTLEKLAQEVEETVYFNIPKGNESIIIDRIDSPRNVKIMDMIGERIPLHIGGPNKTILANMPKGKAENILQELLKTDEERAALQSQLQLTRDNGYAVSYGEKTEGTIAVGSPVIGFNQEVIGAVSVEFFEFNLTEDHMSFIIEKVKNAAHTISIKLGFQP